MVTFICVLLALVVGWAVGKRTGFADGRRFGHREVSAMFDDFAKLREWMDRHTNATSLEVMTPYGLAPIVAGPTTDVVRKPHVHVGDLALATDEALERSRFLSTEARVCGAKCDRGSECLELEGHAGDHETQHGCTFPKD